MTIGGLQGGQYVWTATDNPKIGSVQISSLPFKIPSTSDSKNNEFTITLDKDPDFIISRYNLINDIDDETDGYYKVKSISLKCCYIRTIQTELIYPPQKLLKDIVQSLKMLD